MGRWLPIWMDQTPQGDADQALLLRNDAIGCAWLAKLNEKFPLLERLETLGVGFSIFYFHPYLGKIPILTNISQRG